MSQRRFVNFGTDADASKIKAISATLSAPQLLRATEPFLQAVAPDQLVCQPHSVIFDSGIILDETEQQVFTIPTTFAAADFTLAYEHVDEDVIGGTAAILELRSGLLSTVADGVILGWVRYAGGSVPLDSSMVFPNRIGQMRPANLTVEQYGPADADIAVQSPGVVVTCRPNRLLGQAVPATPFQLAIGSAHVSRLLADASQSVRAYDHTAAVEMTRITAGTPASGEFFLDSATSIVTFAAVDTGNTVDISDVTYGAGLQLAENSGGTAGIVDAVYSFAVTEEPLRAFTAEFIPLTTGYQVGVVEAFDINGTAVTLKQSVTTPVSADGTVGRLVCRLLDGDRQGTAGQAITIRVRQTVPAGGSGILQRVRATNYDLPF